MEQYIFLKEAVCAPRNAKCTFGISFSIISLNSSIHKHNKNTFDALLLWIYSALFTQQIASHRLRRSAIWHCVQWGPRERVGEKKGEGNLNWSLVNLETFFSRMLTWSDQKHPTGTDPCSREGKPLMPLPRLPCWTLVPPVDAWLGAVRKSLCPETKRFLFNF